MPPGRLTFAQMEREIARVRGAETYKIGDTEKRQAFFADPATMAHSRFVNATVVFQRMLQNTLAAVAAPAVHP